MTHIIMQSNIERCAGSFRDPCGYVYFVGETVYRQINKSFQEQYDFFINSGLYDSLVAKGMIVRHEEVPNPAFGHEGHAYKTITPLKIPFVSYPYEWCFSQLKEAALFTLQIQSLALNHGMTLKDCSAYNIQFLNGRPIFIDTLSFEIQDKGPWVAYKQFCQHFLGPLALMSYSDINFSKLSRIFIDGIPLPFVSANLPLRTWLRFSLLYHIHLHAKSQKYFGAKGIKVQQHKVSKNATLGMVDNLMAAVRRLQWRPRKTEWGDYYQDTNYSETAVSAKKEIIKAFLDYTQPRDVWDLGANTGFYSCLAARRKIPTIAFDVDPAAVEKNYIECVDRQEQYILPLVMDLTNPSPGIGWENSERLSLTDRGRPDLVFALALIHHLVVSNNIPFDRLAQFFANICRHLIIEFIPKTDSQVQRLLVNRKDIFADYSQEEFESSFSTYFTLKKTVPIKDSQRILYLMSNRQPL